MLATRRCLLWIAIAIAAVTASPLHAQVVISQVYGGGGNSGATLRNDFIEVFNRGGAAVDLGGWSVQYASSAGISWQVTALSGTIQAGQYYLIQEAQGAGGSTSLPTPDATGTIAMSATAGKVALLNTTTALGGSGCPLAASVQDFVGYGAASCSETSPVSALTNTTAARRAGGGCTDTNNNSSDFSTGAPNPRNTAAPLNPCAGPLTITNPSPLPNGTVFGPYSITFAASGGTGTGYTFAQVGGTLTPGLSLAGATLSGSPGTTTGSPFSFTMQVTDSGSNTAQKEFELVVDPVPTCTPSDTIAEIQGDGNTSPLLGANVTTSGIVTGRRSNGFFIQMPPPGDGDPATSDGVFVFTSSAPPAVAAAGNEVCVAGNVHEFIPSSDPASPSQTEIASPTSIFVISPGNPLPPPAELTSADLRPSGGIDQLERYEGMRVSVDSLTASSPTDGNVNEANATSTSTGVFFGVLTGTPRPFREPGIETPEPLPAGSPCCVPVFDANPERLRVDTGSGPTALEVTTGAVVTGLTGPLEYSQRTYSIVVDPGSTPTVIPGIAAAVPVPPPDPDTEFTIASFNIERFFDTEDDPSVSDVTLTPIAFSHRLNKASLAIRTVMNSPDVIGVEEMENLSTLQALADKVNSDTVAAGGPDPDYRAYLEEGNDVGGIDVGFLVKASRVDVASVTQYGKDTTYVPPSGVPALLNDRPPLVLRASVTDEGGTSPFIVIVNHLRSLSGINGPDGDRIRAKRRAQAEFLAGLVQSLQAGDPSARIVSIGDYNAFDVSDGYVDVMGTIEGTPTPADNVVLASPDLVDPDLTDLVTTLPAEERYSYVFGGSAQVLDHVLVNPGMNALRSRFAYARNDADFAESFRNDPDRPERISDHDLPVAYFKLPLDHTPPVLTVPGDLTVEATSPAGAVVTFSATAVDDIDPSPTVSCAPASGSTFPLADTLVACTATDHRGNTSTGSFIVHVVDTTPPTVLVTGVTSGASYTLGSVPTAGCSTTDTVSTIAVYAALSITGGTPDGTGTFTATCSGGRDSAGNVAPPVTATYAVTYAHFLTALGPARIWLGLKDKRDDDDHHNHDGDDDDDRRGTNFDVRAEVLKNGAVAGSGQVNGVSGGGDDFHDAVLRTIGLTLPAPVGFAPGDRLALRLSVRIAATGRRKGTARLWFNDGAANTRFGATLGGPPSQYYLVGTSPASFALKKDVAGTGPKTTVDVFVDRAAGGNPFRPFGTWSIVVP
jgi:uncharacterized protein